MNETFNKNTQNKKPFTIVPKHWPTYTLRQKINVRIYI